MYYSHTAQCQTSSEPNGKEYSVFALSIDSQTVGCLFTCPEILAETLQK